MNLQPPQDDLETRLDAAFRGTRPRPGFERELWAKIEAAPRRRSIQERLAALLGVGNGRGGFNFVPALAALVVVGLVGFSVLLARGPHLGGSSGSSTATSAQSAPADRGNAEGSGSSATKTAPAPAFGVTSPVASYGRLPKPELGNPRTAELATDSGAVPFFDAAELTWSGQMPSLPPVLPVFRYMEPQKPALDAFAAKLQASPSPAASVYQGADFSVAIFPSTLANGREPIFALTPKSVGQSLAAPADEVARKAASDFLSARSLVPDWDSVSSIRRFQGVSVVRYSRQFAVPGTGFGVQIDSSGKQVGLDVIVKSDGTVFQASGPFPLQLDTAPYRAKSRDAALQDALASSIGGQVKVTLNRVTLVYEALADGDRGYYVPALLFTGLFEQAGQQFEKRLLVQILDPSGLR